MKQLFSLFILAIFAAATSFAAEVELTSFKAVSADADDYISYVAEQGKSATPPAVINGVIRVYQNGGLFTVNAKNGAKITEIVLGSSMATSVTYSVDGADESAAQAIKANAKLTVDELSANSIRFTCKGTSKSARLYVNYLKVAYETPGGTKVVTSIAITGTPAKTEYYTGDKFNPEGLVVTATFDDNTTEAVTPNWEFTPATFTEVGNISVAVKATYGGQTAQTTCPVTVKTIANTKETAYTVEQVIALIDAGVGLSTPVYVKGVVSKIVTPYSAQYKNISFNVSDDGAVNSPQFQFFRNQKDAKNGYTEDPNILVGASVIGYGTLTKYNTTYEFKAGNYLVEYIAPTLAGDINGDGVVNTSDVTALVNAVLGDGDVTLETGDLNDDGLLDVTDATMLIYLLGEEN